MPHRREKLFRWWYRGRDGRMKRSKTPIPIGCRHSWNIPANERKNYAKSAFLTANLIRKYYKKKVIEGTIDNDRKM